MAKNLSPWCKSAKKAMIDKDLSVKDVADETGFSRSYVSNVLNGKVKFRPAVVKISQLLEITDDETLSYH